MTNRIVHFPLAAAFAAVIIAGATTRAAAQAHAVDPRWEAWLGCWQPVPNPDPAVMPPAQTPTVCVTPTATSSAVQVATIDKGVVVARDTIDAGGVARPIDKQGCAGTENGLWSADNRRVYLRSDVTCTGGVKRIGSGIVAMSPTGEWLDVQSVSANGNAAVRAVHYREASLAGVPADVVSALGDRRMSVSAARAAAGSALDVRGIAEAVRYADSTVVQAWIAERGVKFSLSAAQLVALADAGVPGSVTDVMVGVSYPDHFAMQQRPIGGADGNDYLTEQDSARLIARYLRERCSGLTSTWGVLSIDDPCTYANYGYRGYQGYRSYLYDSGYYGYGYGSNSIYSPYNNYGYYGSNFYSGPVVVVRGQDTSTPHGQVIKGRGYTRGSDGSSTSGAASSSQTGSGSSSGSSSSGGSSSGGSSSSGSSGGGSSGRTAHPRPPAR